MKKCKPGQYYCYTDKKCKKIPMGWHIARGGYIEKDNEESETKKNGNGNGGSNGNGNGNGNGGGGGAVSEAAVSKKQQRFFGMVRAAQKGKMENPSTEVAKTAATMSKSDVKKFASTKHKGLPMKKEVEEAYYGGEEQRKKDEKKAKYEKQLKKMLPKRAFDQMGREIDPRSGKLKESKKTFKEFMESI